MLRIYEYGVIYKLLLLIFKMSWECDRGGDAFCICMPMHLAVSYSNVILKKYEFKKNVDDTLYLHM